MAPNRPMLHHTVPQSYLRRFASGEQIAQVELAPNNRAIVTSVRNVAAEKLFHLVEQPAGRSTLRLEHDIAAWEGRWSKAIAELIAHGIDGPNWPSARDELAGFVAFQFLRTTLARAQSKQLNGVLGEVMDQYGGRPADWQDWHPNDHLRLMLEGYPMALTEVRRRSFAIVRFKVKSLITSDNPVTLLSTPGGDESTPLALQSNGGIWLPLSRRVGLMAYESTVPQSLHAEWELNGTARDANILNQTLAMRAHRYIYHHPDDQPLQRLTLPTW